MGKEVRRYRLDQLPPEFAQMLQQMLHDQEEGDDAEETSGGDDTPPTPEMRRMELAHLALAHMSQGGRIVPVIEEVVMLAARLERFVVTGEYAPPITLDHGDAVSAAQDFLERQHNPNSET